MNCKHCGAELVMIVFGETLTRYAFVCPNDTTLVHPMTVWVPLQIPDEKPEEQPRKDN